MLRLLLTSSLAAFRFFFFFTPFAIRNQLLATEKVMLSADCFTGSENNFVSVGADELPAVAAARDAEVSA